MFVPEQLLVFSARDDQVAWLDPHLLSQANAATSASVDQTVTVPEPRALVMTHCLAEFIPTGGQNVVSGRIAILPPTATSPFLQLTQNAVALAANVSMIATWQSQLILPPGWRVVAFGVYNAGASQNTTRLSVGGMLIPVGNIQRT